MKIIIRFAIVMALSFLLIGCTQNKPTTNNTDQGNAEQSGDVKTVNTLIPSGYDTISVNLFEDTWSNKEDGSDLTGNLRFESDKDTFKAIFEYLDQCGLLDVVNSGNFMPDFSFLSDDSTKNSCDFVFTGDDQLVVRDADGNCFQVDLAEELYNELKEYIGKIRQEGEAE